MAYLPPRPPPDPPGGVKNLVFSENVKKVMPIHGGFFQSLALRAYYPLCPKGGKNRLFRPYGEIYNFPTS